MSSVCDLFVEENDDRVIVQSFEELSPSSGTYPVPLQDHPEPFKRLSSMPNESGRTVIVRFTGGLYFASEQVAKGFLHPFNDFCRIDRGVCDYFDLFV